VWRAFGCAGLVAVAGSHACVVLGAQRRSDGEAVKLLVFASIALAALDTGGGIVPISGLNDDVGEGAAKLLAVSLVLLLLTTLLPPIIRRLEPSPPAPMRAADTRDDALILLSREVHTIADRIDELSRGPALRGPEIRHEAQRLRNLARSFQT
jgi:hypothetical protein